MSYSEDLWQVNEAALAASLTDSTARIRRAEAERLETIAEVARRGVARLYGYRSLASWLMDLLGISRSTANKLVRRAGALYPGSHVDGSELPALAPQTAKAAAEGRLDNEKIDAILLALRKIPAEHRASTEEILVRLAGTSTHREITVAAERILAHLDPDGAEPPGDEPAPPRRELSLHRRKDGFWRISGLLDELTGTKTRALLEALESQRSTTAEGTVARRGPDSGREIRADAFADLVDLALVCPDLPAHAGDRATVVVTVDLADLAAATGQATLDATGKISASRARRLACDARVLPAVLGTKSQVLDLGRSKRIISSAQRQALSLRDRGCAFPGCRRPPKHCEGHHIVHWANGGTTDLDNLVLLCSYHHHVLHDAGWKVRIAPDGLPEFIPPVLLDPAQQPRRNINHVPLAA
ncbi:MAG TPA: DUF222 domain-containing protein [Amycolatopsis sp.]